MTTEQTHTPWPWIVDGPNSEPSIWHGEPGQELLIAKVKGLDRAEANARLIAAAPELLTMLQRLTEQVERANNLQHRGGIIRAEDWSELYHMTNESRALIAKAEGR